MREKSSASGPRRGQGRCASKQWRGEPEEGVRRRWAGKKGGVQGKGKAQAGSGAGWQ